MTPKEISFAENYLCTFNVTEAAKSAEYSSRSAKQIGFENLTKP
jgi:phage terminase small subunit